MIATRQWLLDWTGLLHTVTPNNMSLCTKPTDTIPEDTPIQMEVPPTDKELEVVSGCLVRRTTFL